LTVAVSAIVAGVVAGVGAYYAGTLSAPVKEVTKTLERTLTTTTTIAGAPHTVTETLTKTVTAPPTTVTKTETVTGPERTVTTTLTTTTTVTTTPKTEKITLVKLKIAYPTYTVHWAPFYAAKDLGLYEKYGLDVEVIYLAGDTVVAPALASRSIDIAIGGNPIVLSSRVKNLDFVYFYSNLVKPPFYIMTLPEIKSPKELEGKVGAVPSIGGWAHNYARWGLRVRGVDDAKVKYMKMDYASALAALQERKIDWAFATPEWKLQYEKAGAKLLINLGDTPGAEDVSSGGGYALGDWLKTNRAAAVAWVKAVLEATDILADPANHRKLLPIISKYTGIKDEEVILASLNEYLTGWRSDLHVPTLKMMEIGRDWTVETVPELANLDLTKSYDDIIADQALRELGRRI